MMKTLNVGHTWLLGLALAAVSLGGSGCAVRKVEWELKNVPTAAASPWQAYSVSVGEIKDERDPVLRAKRGVNSLQPAIVDKDPSNEAAADGFWINSEEHYTEGVLSSLKIMLGRHLEATKLFRSVTPSGSDLVLSGSLRKLEARRQCRPTAEFFAHQGGLLTMPIALAQDATFTAAAELELRLAKSDSGEVLWEAKVSGETKGANSVGRSPWAVYEHANAAMKDAAGRLVGALRATAPAATSSSSVAKAPGPAESGVVTAASGSAP